MSKIKKYILLFFIIALSFAMIACKDEQQKVYNLYEKTDRLWFFTDSGNNHLTINKIEKIDNQNFNFYFIPKIKLVIKHICTYPQKNIGGGVLGYKDFYCETYPENITANETCLLPYIFYPANLESMIKIYYSESDLSNFKYDFNKILIKDIWCESYYYVPN